MNQNPQSVSDGEYKKQINEVDNKSRAIPEPNEVVLGSRAKRLFLSFRNRIE